MIDELFGSLDRSFTDFINSDAFQIGLRVLVIYFVLCWLISRVGRMFENHFAKPYARQASTTRKPNVAAIAAKPIDLTNA